MADDTFTSGIEIDLGSRAGKRTFGSLDDIIAWVSAERTSWEFLDKLRQTGGLEPFHEVHTLYFAPLRGFIQRAEQCRNVPPEEREHKVRDIAAEIGKHYRSGNLLTSNLPEAELVRGLASRSPGEAAATLLWLSGLNLNLGSLTLKHFAGIVQGVILRHGPTPSLEAYARSLQAVHEEWRKLLDDARVTAKHQDDEQRQMIGQLRADTAEAKREHTEAINDANTKLDQAIERTQTEVGRLKLKYDSELALRAPKTYWVRKKWWHFGIGIACLLLFAVLVGLAVWGLVAQTETVLGFASVRPATQPSSIGSEIAALWWFRLVGIVLPAVLVFWVLQVILRLALSQLHLATDAAQRATLVHSYLALLEAKAVTENDRGALLQAIFRPAATGLVKGDFAQPPTGEALRQVRRER